ncbi:hypothetical protein VCRA2122O341_20317 [Vibrio crassostreae]|nr:hypothetical protein VCRA2122O341_20317 [Vibrio crassostreae]
MLSGSQIQFLHYHKHEKDDKNGIFCPKFHRHEDYFKGIKKPHLKWGKTSIAYSYSDNSVDLFDYLTCVSVSVLSFKKPKQH